MQSLLTFDLLPLVAIFAIMLFAGLVHGTLGLGFPMVATPLLATMMDVRAAILVTLIPTLAVNILSIVSAEASRQSLLKFSPLLVFTLIGSIIGAGIIAMVDPAPFRIALAMLIFLYLGSSRIAQLSPQWLQDNRMFAMAGFGVAAGVAGGTTNVMVAILIIYFIAINCNRSVMVPVLNSCFFIGKASQIVILSFAGFFSLSLALETLPLAITAVSALLIGKKLQHKIKLEIYQMLLRRLLLILAIVLIVQFFQQSTEF